MKPILGTLVTWPLAITLKIKLVLLGFLVIPVYKAFGAVEHLPRIYRSTRGIHTFWETAIRNPVDGFKFIIKHPDWRTVREISNLGTVPDMEHKYLRREGRRFAWRIRYSGWLTSLRLAWIWNESKGGELYFGWKLWSEHEALDFAMSLRPYTKD
jgi:hypothetical protein